MVPTWQGAFMQTVRRHEYAGPLRHAALDAHLGEWTALLTGVVVATCGAVGWQASAKGHHLELLPVGRGEYLAMDVMAFAGDGGRWRFPTAVMELENSRRDDYIAYSLWKVLSVRAGLRVVFCYRQSSTDAPALIRFLRDDVIQSLGLTGRMGLEGQTVVVVGSRADSDMFPYGFFHWWRLEQNTGTFTKI